MVMYARCHDYHRFQLDYDGLVTPTFDTRSLIYFGGEVPARYALYLPASRGSSSSSLHSEI